MPAVIVPDAIILPDTSNAWLGMLVFIPTLPEVTVNPLPAVTAPVAVIEPPFTAPVVVIAAELASKLPEVIVNPFPAVIEPPFTSPVAVIEPPVTAPDA